MSRTERGKETLAGKVALITGAGSGIGRASALLFAREGASVVVADINGDAGRQTVNLITAENNRAIFLRTDVTSDVDCQETVKQTVAEYGQLDVLFNNAGVICRTSVTETSEKDWDRVMAINVKGVFLLSKHAIPVMARSGGGVIINTSSGWGMTGGARAAPYCASKGAVVLLTKAMAIDHGEQNIRINCICPGDTETNLLSNEAAQVGQTMDEFLEGASKRPLGRIGMPEDIAKAALYLASEASSFVTGTTLVVDGGGLAGS
ncbi:MAG TPA: short-chain dehydrogenase [Acidobacteria bacterium]|jgi:NAD(P)-dependent dehydrogenase (short-subunit alcohol dehydrogenase family)|nr:short-chain dehydrogenase [Acidobacteriota bacterium]